jgi:hypothetical protein
MSAERRAAADEAAESGADALAADAVAGAAEAKPEPKGDGLEAELEGRAIAGETLSAAGREPAAGGSEAAGVEPGIPGSAPGGTEPGPAPAEEPGVDLDSWFPGEHDLVPLLPRGTALFEGLPARAVVIDALCPAIGHGAVIVRGPEAVGIVLVSEGASFEQYAFEGGRALEGTRAMQAIAGWPDAAVTAYRFDPLVVAVVPALFRGAPCYQDLRLDWTDWHGLLADLCRRDGSFVVELDTPLGRGVTLIVDGRQVATYTEGHPELGPETLLDPLAATGRGTIWVRREPAAAQGDGEVDAAADGSTVSAPPGAPAPTAGGEVGALDWSGGGSWGGEVAEEPSADPYATAPPPMEPPGEPSGNPYAAFPLDPLAGSWGSGSTGAGPAGTAAGDASVEALAPQLKQVARQRLQRSASRVESMVDEAASRQLPLNALLGEIRGLVIRGVMQSTLDELADEMAALVPGSTD